MKTARELLYDEVTALLARSADDASGAELKKIMTRYRVQTKPGVDIGTGPTARDALGVKLHDLWKSGSNDDATRARMETLIDQFRMQLKQAGSDKPAPAPRRPTPTPLSGSSSGTSSSSSSAGSSPGSSSSTSASPLSAGGSANHRGEGRSAPSAKKTVDKPERPLPPPPKLSTTSVTLGIGEAPARGARNIAEPVAGGPRPRKKARGECPKCKSLGVVLARSYSGDEYYSCIYCGWQAYRPADEDDPNASLALRLLGQTLGSD